MRFLFCALTLFPCFITNASADDPLLKPLWNKQLSLHSPVNVVVGRLNGDGRLCVQGTEVDENRTAAAVQMLDARGEHKFLHVRGSAERTSTVGAYLQWIDRGPSEFPAVLFSTTPHDPAQPGEATLVDVADGRPLGKLLNTTHFGNNNSIVDDIDGDGQLDLVYADQQTLTRYTLPGLDKVWRWDEGIRFCWSLPGLFDLDGDGSREIVFGSEYNNDDGSSSVVAISTDGQQLWRSDGHAEDLGSTPIFFVDVDGDGTRELVKVGLDLEHRQQQEWNHIHIFDASGNLKAKYPFGCTGLTMGDLDGDGHLEGVGLTNTRDGGHQSETAIRCLDLATGDVEWTTPVERAYLDCNSPVCADVNNDGQLEVIVGTGNPAGYARLPNSEPWGDLYVVDHEGKIIQHEQLQGWPVNTAFCDITDDGLAELIIVQDGKPGSLVVYETEAKTERKDWKTPLGDAGRSGTLGVE